MPDNQWHWIHDYLHGFGWRFDDQKVIWCEDIAQLLPKHILPAEPTHEELNLLYDNLQPLIEARNKLRKEWLKRHPPGNFDKITIPLSNRTIPQLKAEHIVDVQPLSGQQSLVKIILRKNYGL